MADRLHGVHLAHVLLQRGGVPRSGLRLIDPHEAPLARWRHVTGNVGMTFLRSPGVHHVDLDSDDLHRCAQSSTGWWLTEYRNPHYRPSLTLFNAHADGVVRAQRLDELLLRGRESVACSVDGRAGACKPTAGRSTRSASSWQPGAQRCSGRHG